MLADHNFKGKDLGRRILAKSPACRLGPRSLLGYCPHTPGTPLALVIPLEFPGFAEVWKRHCPGGTRAVPGRDLSQKHGIKSKQCAEEKKPIR